MVNTVLFFMSPTSRNLDTKEKCIDFIEKLQFIIHNLDLYIFVWIQRILGSTFKPSYV